MNKLVAREHLLVFAFLLLFAGKVNPLSNGGGSRSSSILRVNRISGDDAVSREISDTTTNAGEEANDNDDSDKASLEKINDSTFTTASLMTQLLRNNADNNGEHETVQYLDRVKNPEEVANELESAAKYLHHQAEVAHGKSNSTQGMGVGVGGLHHEDEKNADLVRVLDGLVFLNNLYDALVRPGQFDEQDGPTAITVTTDIHPWLEINEVKNEMTVTLTLTQNWTDPRLAYQSRLQNPEKLPYVTLPSYMHSVEIWIPDTFIMNEKRSYKHDVTMSNDLLRITSKGQVLREQRLTVTVHCPFYKNERFPFDAPTCSLNFTSFSWNRKNLRYDWAPSSYRDVIEPGSFVESSGFTVSSIELKSSDLERDDLKTGASSGLIVEFKLRRNLSSYITKLYLPLGSFCLIAIIGLISPIGPEIGSALSYFMFGLQSIFMAISFTGPDFNWGNGRTALDSYYVLSVLTILLTGIVNIFKLRGSSSSTSTKPLSTAEESYEMHRSSPHPSTPRRDAHHLPLSRGSSGRSSTREDRLWRDSVNFIDDQDMEEEDHDEDGDDHDIRSQEQTTRHASLAGLTGFILIGLKSTKLMLIKLRKRFAQFCYRLNDFSVWILLAIFVLWNSYYWISNLN